MQSSIPDATGYLGPDFRRRLIAYRTGERKEFVDVVNKITTAEAMHPFAPRPHPYSFTLGEYQVAIIYLESPEVSITSAIEAAQTVDAAHGVTFEPDVPLYPLQLAAVSDPLLPEQWGLPQIGAGIAAWNRVAAAGHGNPITIAIIDSGLQSTHQDIDATRITGTRVVAPMGADFSDDTGHGTMLAGTIAALTNNALGVASIANNVAVPHLQLRIIKFNDARNPPTALAAVFGILDALAHNARVINASWHVLDVSGLLELAIQLAGQVQLPILIVAAAGNYGSNNDVIRTLPASYAGPPYNFNNVMAVLATDDYDDKAWFSNYGPSVDIGAPGVDITSTGIYWVPPGPAVPWRYHPAYREYGGTSAAAAHVTAAAALLLALDDSLSVTDIRDHLVASADPVPALAGITIPLCRARGRLAVERAVLGPFMITAPPLGLAVPRGMNCTVTWNMSYNSPLTGNVQVLLNTMLLTMVGGIPNTGTATITVPLNFPPGPATIRVQSGQGNLYTDSPPIQIV